MPKTVNTAMLDNDIERNRTLRASLGVSILGVTSGGIILIGMMWGLITTFLSIGVVLFVVALLLPWVTVQVPYTWGLVAENSFTGNPVVYGAGWHFRYPWEAVSEESNIDLKERTRTLENLTIATTTDELVVKISLQWRPELTELATFRRMDDTTVEDGFFEPTQRFVSTLFARMKAEDARTNQSVISRLLFHAFKRADEREQLSEIEEGNNHREMFMEQVKLFQRGVQDLEGSFGIHVVQVNISDVDFSDEVKKARAALAEHSPLEKLYNEVAGGEGAYTALSSKEKAKIRAEARVISGNATEKQINMTGSSGGVFVNADEN
jgi:regulator of protease activity HflC (stomatin/prohibitin superfamily)